MGIAQPPMGAASHPFFQAPAPMQTSQQLIGAMRGTGSGQMQPAPPPVVNPASVVQRKIPEPAAPPKKKNDLLDFDVFSEFRSPALMTSANSSNSKNDKKTPAVVNGDNVDGASQSALNHMLDISNEPSFNSSDSYVSSSVFDPHKGGISKPSTTVQPTNTASLLDISLPPTQTPKTPQEPPAQQKQPTNDISNLISTAAVQAEKPAPIQYNSQPPLVSQTPPSTQAPPQVQTPAAPSPMTAQETYAVPLEALKPSIIYFFISLFHC